MPGLLLDTPGMTDLFGDTAAAHAAVLQRLDDLRSGGCSQRIAWGKLGAIACISPSGRGVDVRNLNSSPLTGRWELAKPSPIDHVTSTHEHQPIVHLCWSHMGSDLAVVDILGRVSIHTVYIAVDRFNCVKPVNVGDADSEVDALVGMWWLNLERHYMICKPVHKDPEAEEYRYPATAFKPYGPFAARAACVALTRSGVVKMWYGQDQSRFSEVRCDLENSTSSDDVFTHATFTGDKDNTICVAAFTQSRQLRVYKLMVNWNTPVQHQGQPGAPKLPQQPLGPAILSVQRIKTVDFATPNATIEDDVSGMQLTLLELLPPLPPPLPVVPGFDSFPIVMAVFTTSATRPQSVVCQWEVRSADVVTHPSFEGSSSGGERKAFEIRRLPDVHISKLALSSKLFLKGTMVSMAFTDGTVEIRDRTTLKPWPARENNDMLVNTFHAGFVFPVLDPFVDVGLSPNFAAIAHVTHNGSIKVTPLKHEADLSIVTDAGDGNLGAACASLAQQHSYSVNNHTNNDDLLLVADQYQTSPVFGTTFLTEAHRALNLSMDLIAEQNSDKLLRNNSLQRCLSLQNALDSTGDINPRSIPAQNAHITIHLKMASVAFAYFMNNVARPQPGVARTGVDHDSKASALQSLLGVIKWETDLHAYITDALLELARKTRGKHDDLPAIRAALVASNSCALPLVLASVPRWLLRYNLRALRGFDQAARDQSNTPQGIMDDDSRLAFQSLRAILDGTPLKLGVFERMLSDVDASVKAVLKDLPDRTRSQLERDIFLKGSLPDILAPVVAKILSVTLSTLWNDIDPAAVFFYDTTWLGIEKKKTNVVVDTLRKVVLRGGGGRVKVRRCIRCCERVEDLVPNPRMGIWLQSVSRMCVCGSLWMHDQE